MTTMFLGPAFQSLKDVEKFFIGFEDQFDRISRMHGDLTKNIPNYPPYNIKKTGDNTYVIELAVAGFSKDDIEIELNDGKMVIKGNASSESNDQDYLFKGIGMRPFTRTFAIDDHIEIRSADLQNGMLQVNLERIVPEHKKPKKIQIGQAKTKKELLVE